MRALGALGLLALGCGAATRTGRTLDDLGPTPVPDARPIPDGAVGGAPMDDPPARPSPDATAAPDAAPADGRLPAAVVPPVPRVPDGKGPASVAALEAGDPGKDVFIDEPVNGLPFHMWIPGGVRALRCAVGGWQDRRELARLNHCVQMRLPAGARDADLVAALQHFAMRSGRPEIAHLQIVGAGFSAPFGERTGQLHAVPDRFMGIFGGGIHSAAPRTVEAGRVPWLTHDGERDRPPYGGTASSEEQWRRRVAEVRAQGGQFAKAVLWGEGHHERDARHVMWSYFHQVIALRGPPPGSALTRLTPVTLKEEDGWLVSTEDWTTTFPTIVRFKDATDAQKRWSWVPDSYTAHVLRAFVAKGSPVAILKHCDCGDGICQPLHVLEGTRIPLEVAVKGAPPAKLELYDGDAPLAVGAGGATPFGELALPAGVHALIVHATWADGKRALSRPRTVVVTKVKPPTPPRLCD